MMDESDKIIQRFIEKAREAGAVVETVNPTSGELLAAVQKNMGDDISVAYARPKNVPENLLKDLDDAYGNLPDADEEKLKDLGVGISDAFAGVARTGSVCIKLGADQTAAASLFPWKHIVLLECAKIVARPRDVFQLPESRDDDFIYITGPSATADMGELVRGAHGPAELHIILIK